jgi:predicted amidophosphoribosyltransferase
MRKPSLKTLRKKAISAMSKYIIARDYGICCTCKGKGNQAGHFFPSGFWGTRFDERNVHCQCYRCNIPLKGNMIAYYEFMENKYGKKIIEQLKKQSHWTLIEFAQTFYNKGVNTTRWAYELVIEHYTKKLEGLK